jgi:hypothetical protein
MKEKDKFYKIEALVSKIDIDTKLRNIIPENRSKSPIVFNALENNGIKVYEISVHSATARIQPEHITLDISGSGESSIREGFERYEVEK